MLCQTTIRLDEDRSNRIPRRTLVNNNLLNNGGRGGRGKTRERKAVETDRGIRGSSRTETRMKKTPGRTKKTVRREPEELFLPLLESWRNYNVRTKLSGGIRHAYTSIYRVAQLEELLNEKNFHSARHRALITFSNLP